MAARKPTRSALDTSLIVAAVCGWHERHEAALAALAAAEKESGEIVIPAHALVETYAVLTRLPPPHRIAASDAIRLLDDNFRRGRLAGLTAAKHWALLREASAAGVSGGRIYDALIAASARTGGAVKLLTLNARDFAAFESPEFEIVTPAGAGPG